MTLRYAVPTPLEYFSTLVQSDEGFPLLEAAASLAQDEHPGLDVQQVLGEVDQLQARLRRRLAPDAPALQRLHVLNRFFYTDLGFGGNVNHYYDPENSYLSTVLLPAGQALLDPFTGHSLSREELDERLEPFQRTVSPQEDVPLGLHLQAAAPREIIARMLRNLKEVHHAQQDWERLLAVQERLVVLLPQAWTEWRDRGLANAECGHAMAAVADLELYLAHADEEPDCTRIRERLALLRP